MTSRFSEYQVVTIRDGIFYKYCSKCKEEKSLDKFKTDSRRISGKAAICSKCANKQVTENYEYKFKPYVLTEKSRIKKRNADLTRYHLKINTVEGKKKIKEIRIKYESGDAYLVHLLRLSSNNTLCKEDIPKELVNVQRKSLIIHRKIKNHGKEENKN